MPLERTLVIWCSVALTITYLSDIHMHNSQPNPHGFGHPRSHDSLYQLSVDASTFLLRRQAHYSFIFLRSVQMIWGSRDGLAFSQLMVQCWCLNFFRTLQLCILSIGSNYVVIPFIMVSPLMALTGDSQYLKLGGGYCITQALVRYVSHLDRIPCIQMMTSLNICGQSSMICGILSLIHNHLIPSDHLLQVSRIEA